MPNSLIDAERLCANFCPQAMPAKMDLVHYTDGELPEPAMEVDP